MRRNIGQSQLVKSMHRLGAIVAERPINERFVAYHYRRVGERAVNRGSWRTNKTQGPRIQRQETGVSWTWRMPSSWLAVALSSSCLNFITSSQERQQAADKLDQTTTHSTLCMISYFVCVNCLLSVSSVLIKHACNLLHRTKERRKRKDSNGSCANQWHCPKSQLPCE